VTTRATYAYASAYDRSRVSVGQFRRAETRTITADFTAVIGNQDIESVTWRVNAPAVLSISSAAISGKTVTVLGAFQLGGHADLKATIQTSGGETYTQGFEFTVRDCPSFPDEPPVTAGVTSLTVSA
jgi:hypothetical protein